MRVLIVSHNVFSATESMGKTLMAYFSVFKPELRHGNACIDRGILPLPSPLLIGLRQKAPRQKLQDAFK